MKLSMLILCVVLFAATALYLVVIDSWIEGRDALIEKQGFERGVAYAGRKCWYRGYFMDGTQRYNCVAIGNN